MVFTISALFVQRWTEASGADAVCGSCELPGMGPDPAAFAPSLPDLAGSGGAGGTAGTWGGGGGSAGGAGFGMSGIGTQSTGGRKIRDVQPQAECKPQLNSYKIPTFVKLQVFFQSHLKVNTFKIVGCFVLCSWLCCKTTIVAH